MLQILDTRENLPIAWLLDEIQEQSFEYLEQTCSEKQKHKNKCITNFLKKHLKPGPNEAELRVCESSNSCSFWPEPLIHSLTLNYTRIFSRLGRVDETCRTFASSFGPCNPIRLKLE